MNAVMNHTYARTHTAIYASNKLENLVKLLVRKHDLNPLKVVDAWSNWVDNAVRTWLESGHLTNIIVEFYRPGSTVAIARCDFPIRYDGNDVDEMWLDRAFFEESFTKAKAPPPGCQYRIVLEHSAGAPPIPGLGSTNLRSTNGLHSREIGTVISTPDIMASARYYR